MTCPLLLNILNTKNVDHESEIMKCRTLKSAHKYCLVNRLSGQQTGPSIEKYIRHKGGMHKVKASECRGDVKHNGEHVEVKASLGGQNRTKFNYVQIRPSHNITYYILTAYYLDWTTVENDGELFVFRIKKSDMIDLLEKHGSYAHGTIAKMGQITMDNIMKNTDYEYSLRPTYGDKLWKNLLEYRYTKSDLPIEF